MGRRIWNRLAKLRARLTTESGDVEPGDIVQVAWSGPIGFVETVTGDHATVFWHNNLGRREIIQLRYIRRCAADPAFGPDVKEVR